VGSNATKKESKYSDKASLAMPLQGVLTKVFASQFFAPHNSLDVRDQAGKPPGKLLYLYMRLLSTFRDMFCDKYF
jgi:hypothetical protein